MDKVEFKKFTKDGLPLCPGCGCNELWSALDVKLIDKDRTGVSIQDYIDDGLTCNYCGWRSERKEPK